MSSAEEATTPTAEPAKAPGLVLTKRLQEATGLMNQIPANKFPLLLNRLLSKLHLKDGQAFTEAEREQLQSVFGLSALGVRTVIDAGTYVFEEAAYSGLRGDNLKSTLIEAGLEEGHAQVVGSLWEVQSLDVMNKLRGRSLGGPKVLSEVDWHLQLVMGESKLSRGKDTTAVFDLTLARPDVTTNRDEEHINIEFSHGQLYDFFLQLEKVQEQLDHLS